MSFTDELLAAFLLYGMPALFGVLVISSAGVPFPVCLMLVAAGSFVAQGEMNLWQVIIVASTASVLGDQIGYGVARWGGRLLVARISRKMGWEASILKAEAHAKRWGALGIFLSRWLVTPLGPWLNVTSGIAEYSWSRFLLWDLLGNLFGVVLFVTLGYFFSGQVQAMADILGDLPWIILGFVVSVILGWKIVQYLRVQRSGAFVSA
jgi:membrane protein DedA with SNARE-associated domain